MEAYLCQSLVQDLGLGSCQGHSIQIIEPGRSLRQDESLRVEWSVTLQAHRECLVTQRASRTVRVVEKWHESLIGKTRKALPQGSGRA